VNDYKQADLERSVKAWKNSGSQIGNKKKTGISKQQIEKEMKTLNH
jgi:hypothetical protein